MYININSIYEYLIETHTPSRIISYSDNSYSNDSLYKTLKFKFDSDINIKYQYVIDKKRCTEKIKDNVYKIWGCGEKKWIFYV